MVEKNITILDLEKFIDETKDKNIFYGSQKFKLDCGCFLSYKGIQPKELGLCKEHRDYVYEDFKDQLLYGVNPDNSKITKLYNITVIESKGEE